MHYNGFQNPKLGAIRLLRSQGCCNHSKAENIQKAAEMISATELENLLRYKEELEHKVAVQRAKLSDIPCVLELVKQIEELQQIAEGLSKENRHLAKQINYKEANNTFSTDCDEEQDQREHERLQNEYKMLLRQLEKVNDRNSTLVNRLANI